jgi:GTP-binding protein
MSGSGGQGSMSFRREKYVPLGGPDGGDGGRGGDIVFIVKRNLKTLGHLRKKPVIKAENGRPGQGRQKHGKDGSDIEIPIPPGTVVRNKETEEIIRDFTEEGTRWVFLRGGIGGKGNVHFKTSRLQAPRYAQPGKPGSHALIKVELNIMADIGFVGFPNAGKSSLLGVLTNAHPKVADYPFTTRIPHLGVMNHLENDIILADIPGIIEGASQGAGMGIKFLKHISRTKGLAFLLDLSDPSRDHAFEALLSELREFSRELADKKRILIGTKLDLPGTEEALEELRLHFPSERIMGISAFTHKGLEELKKEFFKLSLED